MAVLPEYDPNILQRRLAQELAIAGQQQALQDRAIGLQLEQQLAPLRMQEQALQVQKLQQALNPAFQEEIANRALQRELIGAVASGRNPGLILQPSISPEIQAARAVAEAEGGIPQTAYPSADFRQILPSIGGVPAIGFSPTARQAAIKEAANQKIAEIEARAAASGISGKTFIDAEGNVNFIPTRMIGGEPPTASVVKTTTGASVKAPSKGGLTETSKSNLLARAGQARLLTSDADLDKFKTETGEIDFQKLSIATGRAERDILDQERDAKLSALPAEAKNKVLGFQAVQKDLERLRERLDQEQLSGDIPSAFQDVISASLAEPPTNFFSRVAQRFILQPLQSKTAAENSRLRGAVAAAIGRAIAGAALTGTEKENLIPFTPQEGDSFQRLLDKSAGLEQFLNNQIEGLTRPITTPGGAPVPATTTSAPSSSRFKIRRVTPSK